MILYKYLSPDLISVLEGRTLRFTPPSELNDPFEVSPVTSSLIPEGMLEEHIDKVIDIPLENLVTQYYNEFPEYLKQIPLEEFLIAIKDQSFDKAIIKNLLELFLPQFHQLQKEQIAPIMNRQFQPAMSQELGILCLSECCNNKLMWAHYANEHKGFVIGFDAKHSFFDRRRNPNDECYYLRKVIYSDNRPSYESMAQLSGSALFEIKSSDWKYEQEWRMIAPLIDADIKRPVNNMLIHLFSFPPDAVKTVILGHRIANDTKTDLLKIIGKEEYSHIKKIQAVISEQSFQIDFKPID